MRQNLRLAAAATFLGMLPGLALATPDRGTQCKTCHQDSSALPASHLPIETMESPRCLSCHQISSSGAPDNSDPVLETLQSPQSQTMVGIRDHDRTQEHAQDQQQVQTQTQSQRTRRVSGDPDAALRGQHAGGEGSHGRDDPWSFRLTFGALASDNIEQHRSNSIFHGTSSASFFQPGAEGGGEDAEDAGAGNRLHLGGRADYEVDLGSRIAVTYGARVFWDNFLDEDFSRLNARASVSWQKRSQADMLRLTAYLQQTSFDGQGADDMTDFRTLGANLRYNWNPSDTTTGMAALHLRQREYDGEAERREPEASMSLAFRRALPDDVGTYDLGVAFVNRNNPRNAHSRYDSPSVFASVSRPVSDTMTIDLTAEVGVREYQAEHPSEGVTRSDDFGNIGIGIRDTRLKIWSATPQFSCHYTRTSSNIERFDSDSAYCAVALERRF